MSGEVGGDERHGVRGGIGQPEALGRVRRQEVGADGRFSRCSSWGIGDTVGEARLPPRSSTSGPPPRRPGHSVAALDSTART